MQGPHNIQNHHPGSLFNMRIMDLEMLLWNQEKEFEKPQKVIFASMISRSDMIVSMSDHYIKLDITKIPPKAKFKSEHLEGDKHEGPVIFYQSYKGRDVLFRDGMPLTVSTKDGVKKAGKQANRQAGVTYWAIVYGG